MKLASYVDGGSPSFGVVVEGGIVDARKALDGRFADLTALLAAGALDALRPLADAAPDIDPARIAFLPVIPKPDKVIGIGLNYRTHAEEIGAALPPHPVVFHRFANAQVGHLRPIVAPAASDSFDYEGEIALIIGRTARHVSRVDAFSVIAGYTAFNDTTARDWQFHTSQFGPGKNFHHSGAVGPWMVTADEFADPAVLTLETRLNGSVVQRGSMRDLIFDVPALIEYVTTYAELVPGDIITTGTPSGVGMGRKPPLYLKPGDLVEIDVPGIGVLRNPVAAEER